MRIHGWLLLFCFLALTQYSVGAETPRIFHASPDSLQNARADSVECILQSGDLQIRKVSIFIRNDRWEMFRERPMEYRSGRYVYDIDPETATGQYLLYFILVEFGDYSVVASPAESPEKQPHRVPLVSHVKKMNNPAESR
ncbi:MAG: hypothetical protein COT43_07115 [Candidatus Marinimicrobia bacterium CG08_land_8_20_14_0_20_45_22]|nr:MAG: hypothetical protein COT43_07115 [Candidatus Marinimicrobia bacterium CG08_land_8_20_14_0_20_45_22]